jgi:aldose 1-epimerase
VGTYDRGAAGKLEAGWFVSAARYERVKLRDADGPLEATFVPAAGMLCCSLRHRDEELLTQNAGVAVYAERGKTMGIPLLYPWANRLAGFDYQAAGKRVTIPTDRALIAVDGNGLPIHGAIGGRMAWEITRLSGGADSDSLAARLSWSDARPELFDLFPFRHELDYEVRLSGGQLELRVTLHACGEDAVPVAFGFHPYLSPPNTPRERWIVQLPAMRRLTLDARQIPEGGGQTLPAERFELAAREFDDGFDALESPMRFTVEDGGRRIALEFVEGYPCAQVFAPLTRSCICFEPMTAPANALRSGKGLRLLEPGESHRAVFAIRVEAPDE